MRFLRRYRSPAVLTADAVERERLRARLLQENDLFQGLTADEMGRIAGKLPMATCRHGQLICEPGESGEALFLLKRGHVRIYRVTADGHKLVLDTLGPGTAFGEMDFLGQSMTGSFAEAIDDCTVCILGRVDAEEIILEHPQVAMRMLHLLSSRLRLAEDKLEQMAFAPVPVRTARLLLELANPDEISGYSHQELADMIGTSRESLTRAVVEWKLAGILATDRRSIRIIDRERLGALARVDGSGWPVAGNRSGAGMER